MWNCWLYWETSVSYTHLDLLSNRPDVAVVGGKLIDRHNRVVGGIYNENREPLYLGLHKEYSGYMHRASCQQEAYAVDVRCMICSGEAQTVWEELTGLPYAVQPHTGYFLYQDVLKKDADYEELSFRFCEELRLSLIHISSSMPELRISGWDRLISCSLHMIRRIIILDRTVACMICWG